MKKFTLLVSIMLIWGCSQAQDDAVAEAKDSAKKEVTEQIETVKTAAKEQANEKIEAAADEAVKEATDAVEAVTAKASSNQYQAGIHYKVINPAYETNAEGEVLVYEFFGYPCPHCATFEPYMKKLESSLPDNAKIVRVPVVFGQQWEPFAQAYYVFESMGIVDKAHPAMFDAVHQHKKQFRSIEDIATWSAKSFGVDQEQFLSTAKSFMVDGQVRKGMQMLQAMGVTSTPTLVTNGKFIPNTDAFKTRNGLIEVTEYLVNMEIDSM